MVSAHLRLLEDDVLRGHDDDERAVVGLVRWQREMRQHEVRPKFDVAHDTDGVSVHLAIHGLPGGVPPHGFGHASTQPVIQFREEQHAQEFA